MKKIVAVLAMLAFVISSAFTVDISASIEIGTNIVQLNTRNIGSSEYFTSNNYDDVKLDFGIGSNIFGAYAAIGVDAYEQKIKLYDIYAWVELGSFAKITIGDFSSRTANILTNSIDEYKLGILRYGVTDSAHIGFSEDNTIEGDKLTNFVVDLHAGSTTLSFGMNPYMNKDIPPLNIKKYNLNFGGRAYATIGEYSYFSVTVAYNDKYGGIYKDEEEEKTTGTWSDTEERTTIGTFFGSSRFLNTFGLMVGYTASVLDTGVEHGIDLRVELPFIDIALATHNNLSLYGDKKLLLYNEVKCELFFSDAMTGSVALRSLYYNSNGVKKDSVYNLGIYLDFDYVVTDGIMISTGFDVTGIGNDTPDVMIGIPLKFKVSF